MKLHFTTPWINVGAKVLAPAARIVFTSYRKYMESGHSHHLGINAADARAAAAIPDHVLSAAPIHVLHAITHIGITGRVPLSRGQQVFVPELEDWLSVLNRTPYIRRSMTKHVALGILQQVRDCPRLFNELQARKAVHEHQMASARAAGSRFASTSGSSEG